MDNKHIDRRVRVDENGHCICPHHLTPQKTEFKPQAALCGCTWKYVGVKLLAYTEEEQR